MNNTHLQGAVIDSSLAAQSQGNNRLTTQTLTVESIENTAKYTASQSSVGYSYNGTPQSGSDDPAGGTAGGLLGSGLSAGLSGGAVADSGEASGTTYSAIAPATVTITDNAAQSALTGKDAAQTVAMLDRDTQHANGSISNPYNQQKVAEQLEFLQVATEVIIAPVAAKAAKWIGDQFPPDPAHPERIDPAKVLAHAALGAAVSQLLGTGWQTGATAGALGDVLPQVLAKAFEKDENGKIKDEAAFKAATAIISAVLASATGADLAQTINAAMVTQNAVANNYLKHQEAKRMEVLLALKVSGKCTESCIKEIADLKAIDVSRNQQLEACVNIITTDCNNARQEVRNTVAEYIRLNENANLGSVYFNEKTETISYANSTLKNLSIADGILHTVIKSLVNLDHFMETSIKALSGDLNAQAQINAIPSNVATMIKALTPADIKYLLGAMTPETREQLALAYEQGNELRVGRIMGEQLVGFASAATGVAGGIKVAGKTVDVVSDASKAIGLKVDNALNKMATEALLKSGGVIDSATGKALLDLKTLTPDQKRVIGELFGENTIKQIIPDGQKLARMVGTGETGIDDLYKVNRPDVDYVVIEYKFDKSGLGSTNDGKQASQSWIEGGGRLNKAVGVEHAKLVDRAIQAGRTETWLIRTLPDGSSYVQVLDKFGNVKPNVNTSSILNSVKNLSGAKP